MNFFSTQLDRSPHGGLDRVDRFEKSIYEECWLHCNFLRKLSNQIRGELTAITIIYWFGHAVISERCHRFLKKDVNCDLDSTGYTQF